MLGSETRTSVVAGARGSKILGEPMDHAIFHEIVERIVPTPGKKRSGNHQCIWFGAHAEGAQLKTDSVRAMTVDRIAGRKRNGEMRE